MAIINTESLYDHEYAFYMGQNGYEFYHIKDKCRMFVSSIRSFVDHGLFFNKKIKVNFVNVGFIDIFFWYKGIKFRANFCVNEFNKFNCSLEKYYKDTAIQMYGVEKNPYDCDHLGQIIKCIISEFAKIKANNDYKKKGINVILEL